MLDNLMSDLKISIKELFHIRRIGYEHIKEWLLHKHYAKAIPAVSFSFGLFDKENILNGVCCYGSPANNHNNHLGNFRVLELVRLVVNDGLPKNTLSFFVKETYQFLEKPFVLLSYADQGKNHHGYIYQALNWIYTGLGGGVDFYRDENGNEIHSRVMSDHRKKWPELSRDEIAKKLKWEKVKGTYKHRYFYFLGNKSEKKEMLSILKSKYGVLSYPKGDNIRYDSSYSPIIQTNLF
jgi:hypothetical protein